MIAERKKFGSGAALGSIVALGAATTIAALFVAVAAKEPLVALRAFFISPWSSAWLLGNMLDETALLAVAALGIALAFRAGTFNLGGEGQIYIGGLAAALVLLSPNGTPGPVSLALAAVAGMAVSGAMAAISGALKAATGTDELISSFLLSAAVTPVADYLISGPLRDQSQNLLATARFAHDRVLPQLLPPSSLNFSAPIAILLAASAWIFLSRTATGFRLRVVGASPGFARFAGIEGKRYWTPALAVSGALHGLAGFFAVAGTYGVCHRGFAGGLGWNALAVALIARNEPLALIPAALAYAWLNAGSEAALLSSGLSFETAAFVQAAVLLLVTARFARFIPGARR
jgi:simple sugar transport system permease protein